MMSSGPANCCQGTLPSWPSIPCCPFLLGWCSGSPSLSRVSLHSRASALGWETDALCHQILLSQVCLLPRGLPLGKTHLFSGGLRHSCPLVSFHPVNTLCLDHLFLGMAHPLALNIFPVYSILLRILGFGRYWKVIPFHPYLLPPPCQQ